MGALIIMWISILLVHIKKDNDLLRNYGELWKRIKDPARSINNISGDYGAKYMKIIFNSDEDLPLKKH